MKNNKKRMELLKLFSAVYEPLLKYIDLESYKMLDKKIQGLTALKRGKKITEISNFYKVLEKYPNDVVLQDH